ncbi:Transcription factor PRE4 [Hibiscus syriacus]|uniref:Transcription factor PRE4 n=1 Tax=Hibiscus syriacus TaxID=106335 RepID=A0A6A2X2F3_HIBSY|nr:transcription factor PRE6-like [Hibiscus syriacus]KAE8662670.1 Transcription factor PRE4 [Hibiscus syriacus]
MSGQGSTSSNRITDDELNALIFKLQALLPQLNHGRHGRVSAAKVLNEVCSYIRRLRNEVDDLSERLSQRLDSLDLSAFDAEIVTNLLQH